MLNVIITVLMFSHIGSAKEVTKQFRSWNEACSIATSLVEEGDLIFLDIPNILFRHVAKGTNSWTSHVGIVFKNKNGNWIVAESTIPISREVPLCKYLERSSEYSFEIKRVNGTLSAAEVAKLRSTSNRLLNKKYDLGFDFDSDHLFCSKFVYLVYRSIDVEVGHFQTLRQLRSENAETSITFWRLWFFGSIPWERRTITPASQQKDTKFVSILRGA